jgi:hypothetical protein
MHLGGIFAICVVFGQDGKFMPAHNRHENTKEIS